MGFLIMTTFNQSDTNDIIIIPKRMAKTTLKQFAHSRTYNSKKLYKIFTKHSELTELFFVPL